jgi:hypothetical protein
MIAWMSDRIDFCITLSFDVSVIVLIGLQTAEASAFGLLCAQSSCAPYRLSRTDCSSGYAALAASDTGQLSSRRRNGRRRTVKKQSTEQNHSIPVLRFVIAASQFELAVLAPFRVRPLTPRRVHGRRPVPAPRASHHAQMLNVRLGCVLRPGSSRNLSEFLLETGLSLNVEINQSPTVFLCCSPGVSVSGCFGE